MCFLCLLPCLSFYCVSLSQLRSVLSCILSPPPPPLLLFFSALTHFPSFFLKASLSPDRLAGDKTWSFGAERDIWEQDGERDGGHVPTWSPSPGSVETVTARRWVLFTACVQQLSTCASGVTLNLCSSFSRRGMHGHRYYFLYW